MIYSNILALCVSLSVILLQLTQTRIFSVIFWNHLVYFIISIALLGFGISGTWLSVASRFSWLRKLTDYKASLGFVLFSFLSSFVATQLKIDNGSIFKFKILIVYIIAIMPYFFAGWILGSLFLKNSKQIHVLYFSDLVGASFGCLVYLCLIGPLGAPRLVILSTAIVFIPISFEAWRSHQKHKVLSVCGIIMLAFFLVKNSLLENSIKPESTKAIVAEFSKTDPTSKVNHEFSKWNPISRIDVASSENNPERKIIFIDGDAWTGIPFKPSKEPPPFDKNKDLMRVQTAPYALHQTYNTALVIGSGGGFDVFNALRAQAKDIDAIEINPTTVEVGLNYFREINNDIFYRNGVHLWNEEGRSFIKRSHKKYDLIIMHGIDTFAALSSGAYVLSENYLYTTDAIQDYVRHLSPEGILCITRWNHPAESIRLFATGLEALYQLNIPHPESNMIAQVSDGWISLLIKATPFTSQEINEFKTISSRSDSEVVHPTADTDQNIEAIALRTYVGMRTENLQNLFFQEYRFDVKPVTDDSPFFFNYEKWSSIINGKFDKSSIRGDWPTITLFLLLFISMVFIIIFILLPLWVYKKEPNIVHFYEWTTYFVCLGVSFIFVEIAIMQRLSLLLGHPSRSIAIVLGTLLFSSGVGSYFAKKLSRKYSNLFLILSLMIILSAKGYPSIIHYCLHFDLWLRSLIAIGLVFPLGLCMGIPFPMAILNISEQNNNFVPWAWAINGGATVLGSILAIVLAIGSNFTTVLLFSALGYMVAYICYNRIYKTIAS